MENPFTDQLRFNACRQAADLLAEAAPDAHRFVMIVDPNGKLYTGGSVKLWQANAALASAVAAMLDEKQTQQPHG